MRRGMTALLGAVLLVTAGCGVIDRAGAAAVVDGERYTTSQLAEDFRALDTALGDQDKPGTMDQVNRSIINIFIIDKLVTMASAETGVKVNAEAVASLRNNLVKELGSEDKLFAFAATRGVPPRWIDSVLGNSIFATDLGAKLIGGTDTQAQGDAANNYLVELAKRVDIEVSPRFGTWDAAKLNAVEPVDDLSVVAPLG